MMSLVSTHKVRCRYSNPTDQLQIVRIVAQPYGFFERTVLPHEAICFKAAPKNILEVHIRSIIGATLSDRIPCNRLQEAASESWRYPRQLQQSAQGSERDQQLKFSQISLGFSLETEMNQP